MTLQPGTVIRVDGLPRRRFVVRAVRDDRGHVYVEATDPRNGGVRCFLPERCSVDAKATRARAGA